MSRNAVGPNLQLPYKSLRQQMCRTAMGSRPGRGQRYV